MGWRELKKDFAQISTNPQTQQALRDAYGNVDNIDPWVGALDISPLSPLD